MSAKRSPKPGLFRRLFRTVFLLALVFGLIGPVLVTALYRFVPPPLTFLMVQRVFEGKGFQRQWRPIDEISPTLVRAVIAAEDAQFCEHRGFDFEAIERAMKANERGRGPMRGGSTISQQTAKNVFLWPQRNWVRKGLEAYFTVLIETMWGKRRIMEVYLNSIEMGPGVYGAEAAARKNFGVSAADLTPTQSARLAAILPNPLEWRADQPGPRMRRKSSTIRARSSVVRRGGLAGCVLEPGRTVRERPDAPAPKRKAAPKAEAPAPASPATQEPAVPDPVPLPPSEPAPEAPAPEAPPAAEPVPELPPT